MSRLPFAEVLTAGVSGANRTDVRRHLALVRGGVVRALVPLSEPTVTRAALRRTSPDAGRRRQLLQGGVAAALGVVPGRVMPRRVVIETTTGSLEDQLADLLEVPDLRVAWQFGPPRANQKPVGHLLSADGETLGFAKLGTGSVAADLVEREAVALAHLAGLGLSSVVVPRLLGKLTWRGVTVLVQSPVLSSTPMRVPDAAACSAAEQQIAASGTTVTEPLGPRSALVILLRERSAVLAERGSALSRALDAALTGLDDRPVRTGAWHGDWSPQNVCRVHGGVGAWDWERYADHRPAGFDALHFHTAELLTRHRDAGRILLRDAPAVLAAHQPGLAPDAARLVAMLYLVEVASRYLADDHGGTGSPADRLDSWLMPALAAGCGAREVS